MAKGGYQKRRIAEKKQRERKARKRAERNKKILTGLIVVVVLALIGGITFVALTGDGNLAAPTPTTSPTVSPTASTDTSAKFTEPCTKQSDVEKGQKTFTNPPCKIIKDGATYTATMVTSKGTIVIDLLADAAPVTVNNFVFLARAGYFNNSIFHRVIPEFGGPGSNMVQGGDAVNRDGTGGPGYSFGDENFLPFDSAGFLAMANSGPGTNGSQFFLLDGKVGHLNAAGSCPGPGGCHSVFGRITSGLKVIDAIAGVKPGPNDKPSKDVVLRRVTIKQTAG